MYETLALSCFALLFFTMLVDTIGLKLDIIAAMSFDGNVKLFRENVAIFIFST